MCPSTSTLNCTQNCVHSTYMCVWQTHPLLATALTEVHNGFKLHYVPTKLTRLSGTPCAVVPAGRLPTTIPARRRATNMTRMTNMTTATSRVTRPPRSLRALNPRTPHTGSHMSLRTTPLMPMAMLVQAQERMRTTPLLSTCGSTWAPASAATM